MRVVAIPEVRQYLKELIGILYGKNYFSYTESAEKYVTELFEDIKKNLPKKVKKDAPSYFDRYGKGMKYATFRKSRDTQWYVFFNVYTKNGETIFLVRYIGNNHEEGKKKNSGTGIQPLTGSTVPEFFFFVLRGEGVRCWR